MTNPDEELKKFLEQLLKSIPEESSVPANTDSTWEDVSKKSIDLESQY